MLSLATPAIRTTRRFVSLFAAFGAFTIGLVAQTVTCTYQPAPFPKYDTAGNVIPFLQHIDSGWVSSNTPSSYLHQDNELKIGKIQESNGTNYYLSFLKFDLEGLPSDVTNAYLVLTGSLNQDASKRVGFAVYPLTASWSPSTITYQNRPAYGNGIGFFQAPVADGMDVIDITEFYRNWKTGAWPNYGVYLHNQSTLNYWGKFVSARDTSQTGTNRPALAFTFTPTLRLKMPLPGNVNWRVTTEVGGGDPCHADSDPYNAHKGDKYFAIDISCFNKNASGQAVWPTPILDLNGNGAASNAPPILAAAEGDVVRIVRGDAYNGNYVVVKHVVSGVPGCFTTWYVHMSSIDPSITLNTHVVQGKKLGIMGAVPTNVTGNGVHLHFAVKYSQDATHAGEIGYDGLSRSDNTYLTRVTMEDMLLKAYQVEADTTASGDRATTWSDQRCLYPSSNVQVP